jgi:FAD/FMN-containing dehydrogenase
MAARFRVGILSIIEDNAEMTFADILVRSVPSLHVDTSPQVLESHANDWSESPAGRASAVAFPADVEQVRGLVLAAAGHGIPLVPSGGRTGLSGGAVAASGEVVVSFDRMRRILDFNAVERTVTVEAGVVTQQVQDFASEQGLFYPVSFASEGSSQVGGNIATNAGGIRVLRYGATRERVAGLKVVTGRGDVLDCNRGLVKNASGYDLRHLFVGSEGTLGLICEATLRLVDPPLPSRVMLLALPDMDGLMRVFAHLQGELDLSAFEFFDDRSLQHVCRGQGLQAPFDERHPLYVVTEFDCPDDERERHALAAFEHGLGQGWLGDGLISHNERQARDLWRYREGISESIAPLGPYKNDLSVTISRVPDFLAALQDLLDQAYPDLEVLRYGHIGDGNVHLNILRPEGMDPGAFKARCEEISRQCYELTAGLGGSASAEHGIGLLKAPWLSSTRSEAEIEMMRGIKKVFDPAGILNPGKLFPQTQP